MGKAQSYVSVPPPNSFKAKVNVAGPEGPVGEEGMGGTGNGRVKAWGGEVSEERTTTGRGYSAPVHTQRSPLPG